MRRRQPGPTLFPYTTLFRSRRSGSTGVTRAMRWLVPLSVLPLLALLAYGFRTDPRDIPSPLVGRVASPFALTTDRKSTRLNSSHVEISYAVFCLKKKKNINI